MKIQPYSTNDECNKWFILYLIYSTMLFLHNNATAQCQYYNDSYIIIIESNNGLFFYENIAKMNMRMSHFKRILFYI